jgi:Domain of unknown function (DUF3516)
MAQLLRVLARKDWPAAAALVHEPGRDVADAWTAERFEKALAPFFAEHAAIRTDGSARLSNRTRIEKITGSWNVIQVIADVDGGDDWALSCSVDIASSAAAGKPALRMRDIFV